MAMRVRVKECQRHERASAQRSAISAAARPQKISNAMHAILDSQIRTKFTSLFALRVDHDARLPVAQS